MGITIQVSKGVYLKQLEESDAEPMFNAVDKNREHLKQLFWVAFTKEKKDSLGFIQFTLGQSQQGTGLSFGIWNNNAFVGTVSLVDINPETKAGEIGYWLTAQAQGKGIVTNACSALLKYSFEHLKLDNILIRCVTANTKSLNVIKRLQLPCEEVDEIPKGEQELTRVTRGFITCEQWLSMHHVPKTASKAKHPDEHKKSYTHQPSLSEKLLGSVANKTKLQIHVHLARLGLFKDLSSKKQSFNLATEALSREDYRSSLNELVRSR